MNELVLVDTNILIYAHDTDSPFFQKSQKYIQDTIRIHRLCFALQNFLEAYRIWTQKLAKPIRSQEAWEIIEHYKSLNVPILYPTRKTFNILNQLTIRYEVRGVHIFDAQLVATMLEYGVGALCTANSKDFVQYTEIELQTF